MKDIDQQSNNIPPQDMGRYQPYQNTSYYYVNNKDGREPPYQFDDHANIPQQAQWNERYDVEQMKNMWKKERNRLAAKKSRDKKAVQIRELEYRDKRMTNEIKIFNECILDYDNILSELINHIEYILELNRNENRDDFILLFDCLCRLKKAGSGSNCYLTDPSEIIEFPIKITNERIDALTSKIRENLREFISKKSTTYE